MPSKNESGQLRVFSSMAFNAQHLNVGWISPQTRFCAMRFNMMTLQVFCAATFFALAFLCNNLGNYFSAVMFSLAGAAVPFWMLRASHFLPTSLCQARYRTVLSCTAPSFTHFKLFSTRFTDTLQQSFWFARAQFLRTISRASVSCSPNVRIWTGKNSITSSAYQCSMPTTLDCSLEITHG
jgi:hypothetical protein